MDKDKLIASLNEDLELEYRSIVQYVLHIATLKGAEYQSTLDELSVHVRQELDHALVLARQIDFLGGTPSTVVPAVPPEADPRTALGQDLQHADGAVDRLHTACALTPLVAHGATIRPAVAYRGT